MKTMPSYYRVSVYKPSALYFRFSFMAFLEIDVSFSILLDFLLCLTVYYMSTMHSGLNSQESAYNAGGLV